MIPRRIAITTWVVVIAAAAVLRPARAGELTDAVARHAEIRAVAVEAGLINPTHDAATGRWTASGVDGRRCRYERGAWRCRAEIADPVARARAAGMTDIERLTSGRMLARCYAGYRWRTCYYNGTRWRAGRI